MEKVVYEFSEGGFLFGGTGVLGVSAGCVAASDIADADAVGVVAFTMGADLTDGTTDVDGAVAIDDIVIADALPTSGTMTAVDVSYGVVHTFRCGTTMNDDVVDGSHDGGW